jgi:uncharacterized protein YbjT (DUF2867 family)
MPQTFLVIGATGKKGREVIHALCEDPSSSKNTIYALYRKAGSASALLKEHPSLKLIQGDLDDSPAIFRALGSGPDALFFVTVSDNKDEVKQGRAIISAAVKAGVKHIVYSSIDRGHGGNVMSGVDIWDTKHQIEAFLRTQRGITYTIIRPNCHLENFAPGFISKVYASVWRDCVDGKPMAVVALKDIGVTAAKAMLGPEDYQNAEIDLAGDSLTYDEASRIFAKVTGAKKLPTINKYLAYILVAQMKDLGQMATFYREKGAGAEIQPGLMTWEAYLHQSEYVKDGRK